MFMFGEFFLDVQFLSLPLNLTISFLILKISRFLAVNFLKSVERNWKKVFFMISERFIGTPIRGTADYQY